MGFCSTMTCQHFIVFFCWLVCAVVAARSEGDGPGPLVDTSSGRIVGLYTDKAKIFRSVPYAQPPVGELRWKDPRRALPVPGILQTTEDPPGCPQVVPCELPVPELLCPKRVSEDCLYLNIFTPLNAQATSNLPVMLFIHGGNFLRGYSGGPLYDAQYIANTTSTIVVTINYRLGALGFLVFGKGEDAIEGNFGLRDQRMAMEWVRDNIPNFGGNPEEVTLWGQSAGATSILVHMSSVRSAGLFHKAIVESNPFGLTLKDMKKGRILGDDFAKELKCKDIDCLNKKNITEIANAQEACLSKIIDFRHLLEVFMQWTPVVDYVDLFDQPLYLFLKGQIAPMPMIVGTTSEESVFFIYQAFPSPVSVAERDVVELAIFPTHFQKLRTFYPPSKGDNRPEIAVVGTDFTFTCTTRYAVWGGANNTQRQEANNPTWFYVFNHSLSFDPWGKEYEYCNGHSCHAVELPFVFHTLNGFNFTPSAKEMELADNITQYWTNFAHYGNPNGDFGGTDPRPLNIPRGGLSPDSKVSSPHPLYKDKGQRLSDSKAPSHNIKGQRLPDWPLYYLDQAKDTKQAGCMRFRTPMSEVINDYHGDTCRFWDTIGYDV